MSAVPELRLRAGKERSLQRRHPWLYANAIARTPPGLAPGDTVRVVADDGRFLAWGAFSPESALRARLWGFDEAEPPDAARLAARVAAAVARRDALAARTDAVRLVFGEADGLPGFVADRYGRGDDAVLVVQCLSAGAERWRDTLVDALVAATGIARVHERSEAAAREREGLAPREGPLRGAPVTGPVRATEDGLDYRVDVLAGHKTGFYVDQRDNRARVRALSAGRDVLNAFCYTGGFSLAALAGGARSVMSVDSSADALATARAQLDDNVAAGRLPADAAARAEWREANVFDVLKALAPEGPRFDGIVLDPPKFAPSSQHVDRAARAYKEINLKALRLLRPGGWLMTFSCSGAIDVDLFQKIVAGAVFDARVDAQLQGRLGAGTDHPMLMTHPEGEYLKGLLLVRI